MLPQFSEKQSVSPGMVGVQVRAHAERKVAEPRS